MFQTFPELVPLARRQIYQPKIFGFRINERSPTGPRMQFLRMRPPEYTKNSDLEDSDEDDDDDDEEEEEEEGEEDIYDENAEEDKVGNVTWSMKNKLWIVNTHIPLWVAKTFSNRWFCYLGLQCGPAQ